MASERADLRLEAQDPYRGRDKPEISKRELLRRLGRYKRPPTKAQIVGRMGRRYSERSIEQALLFLLSTGELAITDSVFWLRPLQNFPSLSGAPVAEQLTGSSSGG